MRRRTGAGSVRVEVGCADWDTDPGAVRVEAVRERVPVGGIHGVVSDWRGQGVVWSLPDRVISRLGLPRWLRGCSRLGGEPHPRLVETGLLGELVFEVVQVKPLEDWLYWKMGVGLGVVDELIVDAEGEDVRIVRDVLRSGARPGLIQWEANPVLADVGAVRGLCDELVGLGYALTWRHENVIARYHGTVGG